MHCDAGVIAAKPADEAAPLQAVSQRAKSVEEAPSKASTVKAEANGDVGKF